MENPERKILGSHGESAVLENEGQEVGYLLISQRVGYVCVPHNHACYAPIASVSLSLKVMRGKSRGEKLRVTANNVAADFCKSFLFISQRPLQLSRRSQRF